MAQHDIQALLRKINLVDKLEDVASSCLVIEVITEKFEIKHSVYQQLENIVNEDAIIASNTSSFSISVLAKNLRKPGRFVGMHLFNPAPVQKLVEVVSGIHTSEQVSQSVYELAEAWGKHPVKVASSPGFVVNRIARSYYSEALRSLNEGVADTASLDAVMRNCGGG